MSDSIKDGLEPENSIILSIERKKNLLRSVLFKIFDWIYTKSFYLYSPFREYLCLKNHKRKLRMRFLLSDESVFKNSMSLTNMPKSADFFFDSVQYFIFKHVLKHICDVFGTNSPVKNKCIRIIFHSIISFLFLKPLPFAKSFKTALFPSIPYISETFHSSCFYPQQMLSAQLYSLSVDFFQ